MIRKILNGLRLRRVGLHYNLDKRIRHGGLSCTFVLKTFISGEGESGKYKYLALGCPFFLREILKCRWELSWIRGFFLNYLLLFVHGTCSVSLFGRVSRGWKSTSRSSLIGLRSFGGSVSLRAARACYTEGWGVEDIFCSSKCWRSVHPSLV